MTADISSHNHNNLTTSALKPFPVNQAFSNESNAVLIAEVTLKRFTPRTLATRELLLGDLEKIRACGYGVVEAEGLEGIHCVSAVILDDYHYPVAAVTTIAPAFRLPPDRFEDIGQACIETAEVIRKKLLN